MDKYARLMQKLEVVNVEFFKVGNFTFNCFALLYTLLLFAGPFLSLCYIFYSKCFFLIHYIFAGNMPVV
jgi:hypothetical protein